MASSAATTRKRAQPATHPTVYVGLLMAIVGLLLAMYAYTGTRIYDITYAFIAIGGAATALVGILVAAWGRAVMAARAQRARRGLATRAKESDIAVRVEETPPTVAEPAEKKRRLAMPPLPRLGRRKKDEGEAPPAKANASLFAFRRRNEAEAAPAAEAAPQDVTFVEEAPAAHSGANDDPTADGAVVRITLKCPQCRTEFSAEGVQPIAIACPSCGLAGSV